MMDRGLRPEDFYGSHGTEVDYKEMNCGCWTTFKILPELTGREWNQFALNCCTAFNPTCIRVTSESVTLDSRNGRITVIVDENNKIEYIEKEVSIKSKNPCGNGQSIDMAIKFGENSPQHKWALLDCVYVVYSPWGVFKKTYNGKEIPFPKGENYD